MHETSWAMQLVVRVEKTSPPTHAAVCEAAARSVVALLTAPETVNGEWGEPVRHWESGPIRKVARRARGVRWPEVQGLPGVTVDHAGAQVRAFVPGPVDEVPPELARLPVAGLDLREDDALDHGPGDGSDGGSDDGSGGEGGERPEDGPGNRASAAAPAPPYAAIALNPQVPMSTGKAAAQCGHAAHLLLRRSAPPDAAAWVAAELPVRLVSGVPWPECVRRAAVAVRDAGFTEVAPGTMTAVAWLVR